MDAGKTIWGLLGGASVVVGLLTGIPMFFEMYVGVNVGDFFGWFVENSAWLLPISCLVFGLAVGVAVGWQLRKRMVDAEAAKAAEEKARETRERKAAAAVRRVREMDYEAKPILVELFDNGHRDWSVDRKDIFYDCPELDEFVELEPVGSYADRWTLAPAARKILEEHPELLEPVRKKLKEEERADFAEHPSRYGDKLPHCALVALDALLMDSRVRMAGSAESEAVREGIDYLIEHGVVGEDAISPSASVYVICPAWQRYLDDCGHDEVRAAIAAREYAHDAYGTELE